MHCWHRKCQSFQRWHIETKLFRSEHVHLTHPCFELCRNSSPCYTTHLCQPILNQSPKDTPLNFTSLGLRLSSHTSIFWTLPEQLSMLHHAFVPTHPEPTSQRYITKAQTLRFSSHTSVLNFAGTALHITPHMCANPPWTYLPKIHHKTSDPKIFISHIPVLNFAGTALHITPHMCANPPWTYLPKIHHKTSDPKIFISHICFELCRNSSPCYTTHVSQPILNQRHDTLQTSDPNMFISHIPVLNFAGTALHISTTHVCQPILNQRSKDTPQNLRLMVIHRDWWWLIGAKWWLMGMKRGVDGD